MERRTALIKYYYMVNVGDCLPTYTKEIWEIPSAGTEIWCTAWKKRKNIKPYGDGCHIIVNQEIYHVDQLMEMLIQREKEEDGFRWGIEGVEMKREQKINGYWQKISLI